MELTKEIKEILENVVYWETCPKDYKDKINAYLKSEKDTALNIDIVSYRFDVPNDVVGCAYYSDDAYYDQEGYYMIDQDGNKVRPDEKYLVVK